jgi:predicted nucleotidyltransferase/uncharacterized protein with HEPN domain
MTDTDTAAPTSNDATRRAASTVLDAVLAAREIVRDTGGLTQERFLANRLDRSAIAFLLLRLGEAASRLPAPVRDRFPDVDWARLERFRDPIDGGADGIEGWDAATRDVPRLAAGLAKLLDQALADINAGGTPPVAAGRDRPAVALPPDALAAFCHRWRVIELALFGSALRDDFRPDSDVDVLVTFEEEANWGLFDLVTMQDDLGTILGRPVDLVERKAVEASPNWIRREEILRTAHPIHVGR